MSVSEKPIRPATAGSCLSSLAVSRAMTGGLVWPSTQDELDRTAEHAAGFVGFVDGKLRAARGRNVEVLLPAGEIVQRADDDRTVGSGARAPVTNAAKAMRTAAAVVVRREFAMTPL